MLMNDRMIGPGVKRGHNLGAMKLIDIAPTIDRLMKLNMSNFEGRVLI